MPGGSTRAPPAAARRVGIDEVAGPLRDHPQGHRPFWRAPEEAQPPLQCPAEPRIQPPSPLLRVPEQRGEVYSGTCRRTRADAPCARGGGGRACLCRRPQRSPIPTCRQVSMPPPATFYLPPAPTRSLGSICGACRRRSRKLTRAPRPIRALPRRRRAHWPSARQQRACRRPGASPKGLRRPPSGSQRRLGGRPSRAPCPRRPGTDRPRSGPKRARTAWQGWPAAHTGRAPRRRGARALRLERRPDAVPSVPAAHGAERAAQELQTVAFAGSLGPYRMGQREVGT